jgi:hypothetical protein
MDPKTYLRIMLRFHELAMRVIREHLEAGASIEQILGMVQDQQTLLSITIRRTTDPDPAIRLRATEQLADQVMAETISRGMEPDESNELFRL